MKYDEDRIKSFFNLRKTGQKGWFIGDCPWCGKPKLAVIFDSEVPSYVCKRGCSKGNLFNLLKFVKRLDLVSEFKEDSINLNQRLENKINLRTIESKKDLLNLKLEKLPKVSLPMGFKKIKYDSYLESRGFLKNQYSLFNVGITNKDPLLKGYLIFLLIEEELIIGYLARSKKTKEEIKEINKQRSLIKKDYYPYLRWRNSTNTLFEEILLGEAELILGEVENVFLVEGLTDKQNLDKILNLYKNKKEKCVATFGKKISIIQISKLLKKGVKKIYLMFDGEAIKENKKVGIYLSNYFKVEIIPLPLNKDPGDIENKEEFLKYFFKKESPFLFKMHILENKIK